MEDKLGKYIIESLKEQAEVFGNDLLIQKHIFEFTEKKIEEIEEEDDYRIFNETINLSEESTDKIKKDNLKIKTESYNFSNLEEMYNKIKDCQKCPLGATRNKLVFGSGNPNADVMVIGEGPGAEEDLSGEPFVGRAGKLLTDILKAINFNREDVYIANIVKCRPPGNRNPNKEEAETCIPYLEKQIELIKPKYILCLGLVAANYVLKENNTLTKYRGNVYSVFNAKAMVTYHPAALLRNPNWKNGCWQDVQQFRKLYDEGK